ncbi:hypothetical protein D9757_003668 [Collybiopsis confluens]|uniref:Arylamine N-acetyltransferase n=1 Tax=Collybiopsis confluens TaxID=2823264 RepID=A0A8H5MCW6_9AGAR|nr:hypothetical protein D9757_003668 [Collybiopsis confluens]
MLRTGLLRDDLWIKSVPSLYSNEKASKWLERIKYPGNWSADKINQFPADLENLCLLIRLQIVAFAFENTAMHYTSHHSMDISPPTLYQRLVIEGKGSYCFGMNTFFLQMIRALGYRAYSGSGRINTAGSDSSPRFLAFVHQVLFVQPISGSSITYFVDASGGGSCLTRPILFKHGAKVLGATPSEWHTLIKSARMDSSLAPAPDSTQSAGVEWHLIVTHESEDHTSSSRIMYSFIEDEFFTMDYECSNIGIYSGVWHSKESLFGDNVVCAKCFWLTDEEMENELGKTGPSKETSSLQERDVYSEGYIPRWDGSFMTRYLGRFGLYKNELKKHVGTRSETVETFRTELERIGVLRRYFGIDIPESDITHISGRASALASDGPG